MNEANTMADILGRNESVDEASKRLGLVAPRVTPADIEANIAHEVYFTALDGARGHGLTALSDAEMRALPAALGLLTVCVLVTRNGFTVIGHSAPASPDNYRAELGRRYAKENAVRQLWPLMGYALRERLHVEAAVASASTINSGALRESLALGNTVAGFLGWLSADITELRHVEVPRLADSYDRFLSRLEQERATGDGMPERRAFVPKEPEVPIDPVPPPPSARTAPRAMTDGEHIAAGHEWHSESGQWLEPPPARKGDTVNVKVPPRTQE